MMNQRPDDFRIEALFKRNPGPFRIEVRPNGDYLIMSNGGDSATACIDILNTRLGAESLCDYLNTRFIELGLLCEAYEIHMEHPFPWVEVHEGEIIDGNGEHVREMHDEPQIADFLVKAANAEAKRQGVRFEEQEDANDE